MCLVCLPHLCNFSTRRNCETGYCGGDQCDGSRRGQKMIHLRNSKKVGFPGLGLWYERILDLEVNSHEQHTAFSPGGSGRCVCLLFIWLSLVGIHSFFLSQIKSEVRVPSKRYCQVRTWLERGSVRKWRFAGPEHRGGTESMETGKG